MEAATRIARSVSARPAVAPTLRSAAERLTRKLRECLGSEICSALEDPCVVEVMLNPDGKLFVERLGERIERIGRLDAAAAEIIIGTIAHAVGAEVNSRCPILSAEMPIGGHRFEGLLPPVVRAPSFSIRRRAIRQIRLEDYAAQDQINRDHVARLREAVRTRRNILISGGTGSGKTTLANAVLAEVVQQTAQDRIVVLEDTAEIQCAAENIIALRTSPETDMNTLLKSTLRLRPDRIIVGEVRDGAALTLLKAWNTGHPGGITTVHANSALSALQRLEQLTAEVSQQPMRAVIGQAIDVVVSIKRAGGVRKITEVLDVFGMRDGEYLTVPHPLTGEME